MYPESTLIKDLFSRQEKVKLLDDSYLEIISVLFDQLINHFETRDLKKKKDIENQVEE